MADSIRNFGSFLLLLFLFSIRSKGPQGDVAASFHRGRRDNAKVGRTSAMANENKWMRLYFFFTLLLPPLPPPLPVSADLGGQRDRVLGTTAT